jgi:hypothetical protein
MSYIGSDAIRIYGCADQQTRSHSDPNSQTVPETLTVSATANARKFKGPKRNGHLSIQWTNVTASGATSAATVWYSNLPEPDPTVDAHWWQDTGITSIDLTTTATVTFVNLGNVFAEWVRIKPNVVTSAGTAYCWVRVEGSGVK